MSSRVLIAGCGFVGMELARQLAAAGHEVYGVRRSAVEGPAGVTMIQADFADPSTLEVFPADLDHVVYAASASGFSEAAYRSAYVEGVQAVLEALERQGQQVERVVFTSSTSVYAQSDGSVVDEGSPTEPTSFSGTAILEGEALVQRAGVGRGVALRFGGIYGPGRTRLIDKVRRGEATVSPETIYTNRIHRDDCAGAIAHLLALPLEELDPVYNGVDTVNAPRSEVLRWMAAQVGAPAPAEGPPGSLPSRTLRSNKRVSSRRLQQSGYAFRYPTYKEGYTAMLAQMGLAAVNPPAAG